MAPKEWIRPDWPAPARVRAFVTTRSGGVSAGAWATFNLGEGCGDDPQAVVANRRRLAEQLPAQPGWLKQVHGRRVIRLDDWHPGIEADAAWTNQPGIVAAVLVADCLPVLIVDRDGTVVAAAHAGWRGLAAGVLEQTVRELPVDPDSLIAWIGPGIGRDAYRVGTEVFEALAGTDGKYRECFIPTADGGYLADLKQIAIRLLAAAGVGQCLDAGLCTYSDPDRFYSHRRDGITGRMAALILLEDQPAAS